MILGQAAPAATTLVACYTVPASKRVTARVIATNRGALTTFRIALAPDGAADANSQYVVYDMPIEGNDSLSSEPIALDAADVVRVYSTSGNVSFTVTGVEQ